MNDEDFLMHYGRKGQKWYQHLPDVLARMNKKNTVSKSETPKVKETSTKSNSKSIKDMSDEELRAAKTRLELEREYKKLLNESAAKAVNEKKVNKGKEIAKDIAESAIKDIGKQTASWALGTGVNTLAKALGAEDNIVDPKLIQKKKK